MSNPIKIAYLYEDLMNTYGDSGDVKILTYLLNQEGYEVEVKNVSLGDEFNADDFDFLFFGGGQDFEQTVVAKDLPRLKDTIGTYIEDGNPMLAICGGYQFLGDYYKMADGTTIDCLGILPLHTVFNPEQRMIGDTKFTTKWGEAIAFENHSGQTYFDDKSLKPLGQVIEGFGNNPTEKQEGLHYKNTIGSYAHGPILKNENIAKEISKLIIQRHSERTKKELPTE